MQNGTRVFVLVRLYFVSFRVIYIIYNQMCEFIYFFFCLGERGLYSHTIHQNLK